MRILRPPDRIPNFAPKCVEHQRLIDDARRIAPWKKWGTYIAERAWGTVREDYSKDGDAWNFISHDLARSVAYRWGEDGIAGWCDDLQYLCFAPAFWNGRDPILKERAFGLTNSEGNHGEDVKEYYFYLDATPTHSYAKYLYKYPQRAFPYEELVRVNAERAAFPGSLEYELLDTGIFKEDRYFDIFIEYAKASPESTVIRIQVINRGPEPADFYLLPTLWFRNIWSCEANVEKPNLRESSDASGRNVIAADHHRLGRHYFYYPAGARNLLFTENATNPQRFKIGAANDGYFKDALHDYVVHGNSDAVNPAKAGTKAAPFYFESIAGGAEKSWIFVLSNSELSPDFSAEHTLEIRKNECDEFWNTVHPNRAAELERKLQRQSLAGLLWNKQFYSYDVQRWMDGDEQPIRPTRKATRNLRWRDLEANFVMSMPDKWEYPWFAAWDLSLQCVSMALVDPDFAKEQLLRLVSDQLMHPSGQIPAYEWEFSDANPPIQAWAAWKVYQSGRRHFGIKDRDFLERMFQKLLLNFAWWVNRKDANDNNIFEGGFLGLDNISVFDRSETLPGGGLIEQCDGTAWMGLFSLNMMRIAFELALGDPVYEDMASKFFEHFMTLANAINMDASGVEDPQSALGLWDEKDGFYYDQIRYPDGRSVPLRVRSLVGLLPMIASEILYQEDLEKLPVFKSRYEWFINNQPQFARTILTARGDGDRRRHLISIVGEKRLRRILRRLLDENEFLAPYGLRSLSKIHQGEPFVLNVDSQIRTVAYEPAEALCKVKGGNSNWRGPIWFPTCCLLLDTLMTFDKFIGDAIKFPFPAPDGSAKSCADIAEELGTRMIRLFEVDPKTGRRTCFGGTEAFQHDPHWKDLILFFEYFHGDNGAGLGAMHQTGWTAFVANIIDRSYRMSRT